VPVVREQAATASQISSNCGYGPRLKGRGDVVVIAREAKQSISPLAATWIASAFGSLGYGGQVVAVAPRGDEVVLPIRISNSQGYAPAFSRQGLPELCSNA
jgi:hypothetical protein